MRGCPHRFIEVEFGNTCLEEVGDELGDPRLLPVVFLVVLGVQRLASVDPDILPLDAIEESVLTLVQNCVVGVIG